MYFGENDNSAQNIAPSFSTTALLNGKQQKINILSWMRSEEMEIKPLR